MATESVDDLAQAIVDWLDDNTPRFEGGVRRTWGTPTLVTSFRKDLQTLLLAPLDASVAQRLILRMTELLGGPAAAKHVIRVDWSVIRSEDARSSIFRQIQQKLSTVLTGSDLLASEPIGLTGEAAAEMITEALRAAAILESAEPGKSGKSLIDVLRAPKRTAATADHMRWSAQERARKRWERARLFVLLLGVVIFAVSLYSIIDRHFWLMPSALFFSWFGYWTLVVTLVAQARTSKGKL